MQPIRFINNYNYFLDQIGLILRPELLPIVEQLKVILREDFKGPDRYFKLDNDFRGYILDLIISKALYNHDLTETDPPGY